MPSGALGDQPRWLQPGRLPTPAVSGQALFRIYREHNGPDGIAQDEMWHLHMSFLAEGADARSPNYFATACYIEQALPLMAALGRQQHGDLIGILRANAEAGGDGHLML